jgi:molybdopterin-guanine dinucleotide biosynthesis protein A
VAAIAAGRALTAAALVVVLAADLPWIAPAVPELLAAVPDAGVALLVDAGGRVNHLAAAWQGTALDAALRSLPRVDGAAVRDLVGAARCELVADREGWGRDCDTWEDLAAARARGEDR